MALDSGRLFALGWRIVPRLPRRIGQGMFDTVARIAYRRGGKSIDQLRTNLARISPDGADLDQLTRSAMRHYMRYYCEVFQLPRMTETQVDAQVRPVNLEVMEEYLESGKSMVAALGHCGNWDLAGAWAVRHLAPVLTVAEKLKPESLFTQFLEFRQGLGMTIVPFEKGQGVFRQLLRLSRSERFLAALLADRDLTRDGLAVQVAGHQMRVAPGAAALALAQGVPLIPIFSRHERITGSRRRVSRSRWGTILEFGTPIPPPRDDTPADAVAAMMQAWADQFTAFLERHPEHWHMLQPVFEEDLDLARLARSHTRG